MRNWKEYNQALVDRGKVLFWITEEAMRNWQAEEKTGKRGKPKQYSDTAIQTALTLQQVFRLPLRATEGFLASILGKFAPALRSPDHSTLPSSKNSCARSFESDGRDSPTYNVHFPSKL